MKCDSLYGVKDKADGKLVAGYSGKNAYTSEGRAKAAVKQSHGSLEKYEVVELVEKGTDETYLKAISVLHELFEELDATQKSFDKYDNSEDMHHIDQLTYAIEILQEVVQ